MATHFRILAWRIPWTEEPSRLHTVHRVTRVRHDLVTKPPPPYCGKKLWKILTWLFREAGHAQMRDRYKGDTFY